MHGWPNLHFVRYMILAGLAITRLSFYGNVAAQYLANRDPTQKYMLLDDVQKLLRWW